MPSAERVNWAKLRVTLTGLVGIAILMTLFYLLTGGTLFQEKATLYLYIPDATGLGPGSSVQVDGIEVGRVSSVILTQSTAPNRVIKVTITVERDHLDEIPADSTAQISAETMVGDMFVDISSGASPQHMRPDSEIRYEAEPSLLKTLDLTQFEHQVQVIDGVLSDIEQGRSRVGQFVVGESVYNDLRNRLTDAEKSLREARETTNTVGRLINTDELYRKIADPLIRVDQSLAQIQAGQGGAGKLLRDVALYSELSKAATDLRGSVSKLRGGEFMSSDAMYAGWNRRIASLAQSVAEFNAGPLFRSSEMYDNLNGAALEMRSALRDFRLNPKKFLRTKVF